MSRNSTDAIAAPAAFLLHDREIIDAHAALVTRKFRLSAQDSIGRTRHSAFERAPHGCLLPSAVGGRRAAIRAG